MKRAEGFFEGYLETQLFFQTWQPTGTTKGWCVITHGQGEHSESYRRLVPILIADGWSVLAWDLRGHGQSQGQRGYAGHFLDYIRDFEMLWSQVLISLAPTPRVFFGHSMGALIQMKALSGLLEGPSVPQIVSSPYLGLALQIPAYKDTAASLIHQWVPHLTLSNEIRNEDLSRDPEVLREYDQDTLRHHKISAGVHVGAQESQRFLLARPQLWKGPFLMLLAEEDPVVSTHVALEFFERLTTEEKACRVFPNRKHELVNDLGRDEVFSEIRRFLVNAGPKILPR